MMNRHLANHSRSSHGRSADKMGSMNGIHMKDSSCTCEAMHPPSFPQLVSLLLPKIHFSEELRPAHGFFSDLIS